MIVKNRLNVAAKVADDDAMRFEWDERKAEQNVAKHGTPFEFAARVFLDPYRLDGEDTRRDYGERAAHHSGQSRMASLCGRLHHARREHTIDFSAKGKPARTEEIL